MAILILNGSPSGKKGNCEVLVRNLVSRINLLPIWSKSRKIKVVQLSEFKWSHSDRKRLFKLLEQAEGFIFVTGTYWDSWGSPLQTFLENVTPLEGGEAFLGKPAVVLVLNHSVGGKGVLSRLQGVLSTMGCVIPPMSGMVYSWVSEQVLKNGSPKNSEKDLWSLDDLTGILENFEIAIENKIKWKSWPVDLKDYKKIWLSRDRRES